MKHRIVVLGAGYAGTYAAGNLARRLHPDDVEITVVNAEPDFVERLRLHQLAAGQDLVKRPLADMFAGTGVRLRLARVEAVDPERKTVTLTDGELAYDTLVFALGSTVADHGVPGVTEHAFHVTDWAAALRLRDRLESLGEGGRVLVAGGGLTGIEAATEITESKPGLKVTLATRGEPGAWMSPGARRHLRRAFDRLGVAVHPDTRVVRVEPTRVICDDGTVFPSEATVWCGGFAVHPIAAAGGLEVADTGQIVVDGSMRSVSHPDVYAAGDSAYAIGEDGRPLPMSCASAGFTSMRATAAIIGRLTGREVFSAALKYYGNHISLGRRDAIVQMVDGDVRAKSWYLRGRTAARVKNGILNGAAWSMSHPTFGMPARRRRLRAASGRAVGAAVV